MALFLLSVACYFSTFLEINLQAFNYIFICCVFYSPKIVRRKVSFSLHYTIEFFLPVTIVIIPDVLVTNVITKLY